MTFSEESYQRMLDRLFSMHPSVQSKGFSAGAYKPGTAAMEEFDRALGCPWKRYRTIHIAGTNGKGSVSSMLAANLAASGLKVGLYTSPHLVDFRERMKVVSSDGSCMVGKEDVWRFVQENEEALSGLSFFEITTGLAFWWFAEQKVDAAVIEVGLGGRLDSTNVISPEISIVTSIGLDHCQMLGDTREAIAAEKAGIFKPGVPALVWGHDPETDAVFIRTAEAKGARLSFADDLESGIDEISLLGKMDLRGPCQELNLHTVLAALKILDISIDEDAIARTAGITAFRGRWEKLCDIPETICDIGHNPAALRINFSRLQESGRPLVIVYGIMADKDLDGISPLMPSGARYILAAPETERALPVEVLAERLRSLRPDLDIRVGKSVADAVRTALELASEAPETLVYIGGSTFVVSEAVNCF